MLGYNHVLAHVGTYVAAHTFFLNKAHNPFFNLVLLIA